MYIYIGIYIGVYDMCADWATVACAASKDLKLTVSDKQTYKWPQAYTVVLSAAVFS